jgi:hypothetical protein
MAPLTNPLPEQMFRYKPRIGTELAPEASSAFFGTHRRTNGAGRGGICVRKHVTIDARRECGEPWPSRREIVSTSTFAIDGDKLT